MPCPTSSCPLPVRSAEGASVAPTIVTLHWQPWDSTPAPRFDLPSVHSTLNTPELAQIIILKSSCPPFTMASHHLDFVAKVCAEYESDQAANPPPKPEEAAITACSFSVKQKITMGYNGIEPKDFPKTFDSRATLNGYFNAALSRATEFAAKHKGKRPMGGNCRQLTCFNTCSLSMYPIASIAPSISPRLPFFTLV